ncbi:transcriptional regulator [Romboutsia weinsteinii]|uniref:Transcriptional regulator n=1 Tax=Romboutsia weinsteinii TaxID=2020949 RepID=A0A371J2V7_9FIRM|nr:Mor transcription activator family protein [Romboutsia weinsteinii]RDY27065.1 transcriptional regulator [Romboutsia weinsteinii]
MRINIEDIPENLHSIIDVVGEDKFIEIVKLHGGDNLYIPTYKKLFKASRNQEIISKFNGANASQLGRQYNLSANQIRRIVNMERKYM